jgi:S-DNA-T family DNA segregation ATPase FtsK/SpoIIIE
VPGPADAAPAPEATGLAAATETAAEPRTDATAEEAAPEAPAAPAARRSRWWAPPRLPGFDFAKRASEPVPDEDRVEPPLARADEGAAPGEERPLGDLMTALRTTPPPAPEGGAAAEGGDDPFLALDLEPAGPPISDPPRKTVTQPHRQPRRSRRAEEEAQPSLVFGDEGEEGAASYAPPALALLQAPDDTVRAPVSEHALEENARMLETVLEDYGVRGEIVAVKPGPVVTLYELEPAPGLKASRVIGLADDIARSMSALSARVSTMPGRSVIGIELPNDRRETVFLRELIESPEYGDSRHPLALALGKDIEGTPVVVNLAKMPHLLIAGTTGSGKSVAVNTMILSLLYRLGPQECRIIMIDPKMLELSVYDGIPHLLTPVVTDPKKAVVALKWVVAEMEERYRKMSRMGVRNIDGYNARVKAALERGERFERRVQTGFDEDTGEPVHETESFEPEPLPLIVVIVDEMADLMMVAGKEIEACIQRLAQMARASGIHLIMATQRPSVDVITGTIKANFPTRISFQVTSKIDSRTILGEQGAEQLLGQGDMLYMAGGGRIRRLHGPFVSDQEVEEVVMHLKSLGEPDYVDAVTEGGDEETQAVVDEKLGLANPGDSDDTLYDKAVAIVARDRKCSTSYVQRKLQIGYNKAARLVEQMETEGVVSPANQVGKREILIEER